MKDPWNATHTEIEAWARQPNADWPTEDWDLAVTRHDTMDLVFRLASDTSCPSRYFFLGSLYLFIGDAFRTQFRAYSQSDVDELLAKVSADSPAYITRWAERTRALLAGDGGYSYDQWCDGGLAREERDATS